MVPVKSERFEMRLDESTLERVDLWRSRQADLPSRAEGMRRLIEAGLRSADGTAGVVKLDDGSKLIAMMLCGIYKHLGIRGDIDPELVEDAIAGGHYWGLRWEYPGIFHDDQDREGIVREVADILDMWSLVESGSSKLSKAEKGRVNKEAEPLGGNIAFRGFDGNYETAHMSVARFMIKTLKRFTDFSGRDLNSHMPTLEGYRRMLRAFEPMRKTLLGVSLNASQIIDLIHAQDDSSRRKA
jgi:uncharacterized protein